MKQVKPCPFECNTNDCKDCGAYTYSHHTQTNEEWMHTLNTEQLADVLAKQKCDGCHDEPYDERYGVCKYCMMKKKEQIMEWLKKPHTNKEE